MRKLILLLGMTACLTPAGHVLANDEPTGPFPLPQAIETLLNQVLSNAQLHGDYVAVVPLVKLSPTGAGCRTLLGQFVAERVGTLLIKRGGQTVERSRLDAALEELDLNRRPTFDRAKAQQLGKLVGARYILTGSLTELVNSVEVDARLFTTETGTSAGAGSVALVKDQDILRLLAAGEAGCADSGSTSVQEETSAKNQGKPVQSDTKNGVRVDLLGCQISASRIICSATITQAREGYNHVTGGSDGSYIWDMQGNQYPLSRVKLGAQEGTSRADGRLPANVPTRVELVFEGVPSDLKKIRALVVATYQQNFTFQNIDLSR